MFRSLFTVLKLNRLVRSFVVSDLVLFSGWGMVSPIFSIFISTKISSDLVVVGASAFVYWFVRSIIQLPIADYLDNKKGEKDDFYALLIGLLLSAVAAFSFIFITNVPMLYAVQVLHGFASGLYATAWSGMFTRHLDKNREASGWALDSTILSFASALTGLFGGFFADLYGFNFVFIGAGIMSIIAAFVIFLVPDLIFIPEPVNSPKVIVTPPKP